jgi:hypothetical protein
MFAHRHGLFCLCEGSFLPIDFDSFLSVGKVPLRKMAVAVCRGKIAVAHKAHERKRVNPALNRPGALGVTAIVELEGRTNLALCQSLFVSIPELCHGPIPIGRPEAPSKWEHVAPLRL